MTAVNQTICSRCSLYTFWKGKLQDDKEGELLETKVGWFLVDIGEYDTADEVLGSVIKKLKTKYGKEAVELADPLHAMMTLIFRKGAFVHFSTATTFTIVLYKLLR